MLQLGIKHKNPEIKPVLESKSSLQRKSLLKPQAGKVGFMAVQATRATEPIRGFYNVASM